MPAACAHSCLARQQRNDIERQPGGGPVNQCETELIRYALQEQAGISSVRQEAVWGRAEKGVNGEISRHKPFSDLALTFTRTAWAADG